MDKEYKLNDLLSIEETAKVLGMPKSTLYKYRSDTTLALPFVKIKGTIKYQYKDILTYIERIKKVPYAAKKLMSNK